MSASVPGDPEVADLERDYTLLGEIGRGGTAIVYRARDRALQRDVAIKVVRPRFAANAEQAIERLERESRTVARLQHPNIVTVYAVRRLSDGGLALVMQYVPGRTLKQAIIDDGAFDAERTERVLRDIADALAYAHRAGVVHRDVKPENIFLDSQTGRALLADFGIAHAPEEARLTMTGAAIGTPAYMAPEQIDGAPANARSDLYSLGLVAWEMLTGHRPWEGEALYSVIFKQKHEQLPAIDAVRPGEVPPRLQYIVERMLQKKPAARWAGADGLLAAMNAWVVPSDWKQWEESHRRRRARDKDQPKPSFGRAGTDPDATIPFSRPIDGSAPFAADRPAPAPAAAAPAAATETIDVDDEAPSWASEPAEELTAASRPSWRYAAAALVVLVVGGSLGRYVSKLGPFSTTPAQTVSALNDRGTVSLPVLSDSAAGVTASPADSAGRPATDPSASDGSATGATSPSTATARADSVTRGLAESEGLARDSLNAVRRQLREARAAAAALTAAPPRPATTGAPTLGSSSAPSGPSSAPAAADARVRATDDAGVIAAGGRHTCTVLNARVLCWGANDRGQLGDGDVEARGTPAPIVGDLDFVMVTTGTAHSCGIARGGAAYCWGANDRGQLGDATVTARSAPVRVAGNDAFRVIRAGQTHTCGLTNGGSVLCWGANDHGQLGDGSSSNRTTPTEVSGGQRFVSLSVGWSHTCAIATDGVAYCWGANANGQVGNGTRADVRVPTALGATPHFTSIAAGGSHSCAVSDTGEAYCWGRNAFGQLGIGGTTDAATPTPVSTSVRFASVSVGGVHSCGRTRGGQVWCWGRNLYGQLGDGSNTTRETPTRVIGPAFVAVNASGSHTCGVTGDDETWCWGYNVEGQLGDGSRNHLARPTRVTMPAR